MPLLYESLYIHFICVILHSTSMHNTTISITTNIDTLRGVFAPAQKMYACAVSCCAAFIKWLPGYEGRVCMETSGGNSKRPSIQR